MPKKRLLIFLFIIASLSFMTYQNTEEQSFRLQFLNNAVNSLHGLKSSIKSFVMSPFRMIFLREKENRRLKAELEKLMREKQKYHEAIQENKKLKEILSLREREHRYVTTARIIAKSIDPWSHTLTLDKGASDGITKDMTVVTTEGLVGKISGVSHSYSYLLPLVDINFSASVRLQESRTNGIISGTGFRKCRLKYVPHDVQIREGEIVVSSGTDLLFPPGIPVGYVSKIGSQGMGIFQAVEVTPFVDISKTEFITIIRKE
ncbi:MAG: rod shape-determining protein MreC [Nitrospirota bacterium]